MEKKKNKPTWKSWFLILILALSLNSGITHKSSAAVNSARSSDNYNYMCPNCGQGSYGNGRNYSNGQNMNNGGSWWDRLWRGDQSDQGNTGQPDNRSWWERLFGRRDQSQQNNQNNNPGYNQDQYTFQNEFLKRLDEDDQFRHNFITGIRNDDTFRRQLLGSVRQEGMMGRAFADRFENDANFRNRLLDRFENDARFRHTTLRRLDQWSYAMNY